MRKADFAARIKKIEIVNRVRRDRFMQALEVTLGDVALTDENLCELRQFRPHEVVRVELTPAQVALEDHARTFTWEKEAARPGPEPEEDLLVEEEDGPMEGRTEITRWVFGGEGK